MSFSTLQIRYQTARSLPAPYAYFYTLEAKPANGAVQIDLAITYPDRDDIDDDELMAEGFTRADDFRWAGQLPGTWLQALTDVAAKTRLQPLDEDRLVEDDDFWSVRLGNTGNSQPGKPANADDWQYVVQELIQATYEADKRESPFELTFLDNVDSVPARNLILTASFANRTVIIREGENERDSAKPRPWSSLQRVMSMVYGVDFDPEKTLTRRPKSTGQWLNLGTEEWYDISGFGKLIEMLRNL